GRGVRRGVAVALRAAAGAVAGPGHPRPPPRVGRRGGGSGGRRARGASGAPAVVVAPGGFVSDHVEVVWALDTEARERAAELGMGFARAATAGPDPRFADMVVELIAEHLHESAPSHLGDVAGAGCTVNGAACAIDCCAPAPRPT